MSRSYKKSPVITNAVMNRSNKKNKQACNQRLRAKNNKKLKELALNYNPDEDCDEIFYDEGKEVTDIWTFEGDGKTWLTKEQAEENNGKYLRK